MNTRPQALISSRKQPKQARSAELVAAILDAAVQVLRKEGAQRFTTARVAERAGVSVGSLYQYFPNKAAILFRLQNDEWRQTAGLLRAILGDPEKSPLERLRRAVHAFIRSECDEAAVRVALNDAAPLYRTAPEAKLARSSMNDTMRTFIGEALPGVADSTRSLAGEMVLLTLSEVGKRVSETGGTVTEIEARADAVADMVCAYLESLERPSGKA